MACLLPGYSFLSFDSTLAAAEPAGMERSLRAMVRYKLRCVKRLFQINLLTSALSARLAAQRKAGHLRLCRAVADFADGCGGFATGYDHRGEFVWFATEACVRAAVGAGERKVFFDHRGTSGGCRDCDGKPKSVIRHAPLRWRIHH